MDNANVGNTTFSKLWEVTGQVGSLFNYVQYITEEEMVKINGKELDASGMTVSQYLDETNYDRRRIAIDCALNRKSFSRILQILRAISAWQLQMYVQE